MSIGKSRFIVIIIYTPSRRRITFDKYTPPQPYWQPYRWPWYGLICDTPCNQRVLAYRAPLGKGGPRGGPGLVA